MDEYKLCSDGVFMPADLPCPPPYSGPYYYYPYDQSTPSPPAFTYGNSNSASGTSAHQGASSSLSAGAVAGIMVFVSFLFAVIFVFAIKFRTRFIRGLMSLSGRRNRGVQGHHRAEPNMDGNDVVVNVVGASHGGLGEKLVNLLPVSEYVSEHSIHGEEGKQDLQNVNQRISSMSTECAVCLSLFEEKDIVRVLPKCHHTFHIYCIDKWFESHVNCPLCRERITLQTIQLSSDDAVAMREEGPQVIDQQHEPILDTGESAPTSRLINSYSQGPDQQAAPANYRLDHRNDHEDAMICPAPSKILDFAQQHQIEAGPSHDPAAATEVTAPTLMAADHPDRSTSATVLINGVKENTISIKSKTGRHIERSPYIPANCSHDEAACCGDKKKAEEMRSEDMQSRSIEQGPTITKTLTKSRSTGSVMTHHLDRFTSCSAVQASKLYLSVYGCLKDEHASSTCDLPSNTVHFALSAQAVDMRVHESTLGDFNDGQPLLCSVPQEEVLKTCASITQEEDFSVNGSSMDQVLGTSLLTVLLSNLDNTLLQLIHPLHRDEILFFFDNSKVAISSRAKEEVLWIGQLYMLFVNFTSMASFPSGAEEEVLEDGHLQIFRTP